MQTESSPPPTSESTVLRPVRESWRNRLPRVALESALIVFSVLLALVLNEWRDDMRLAARANVAFESILAEVRSNRVAAERAMQFHRSIRETLSELAAQSRSPSADMVSGGLFNPANLVETAWTSAREAGVTDEWPYELVLTVSRTYERQAIYNDLARQLLADIYMDLRRRGGESVFREGAAGMLLLSYDFANREEELLQQYDAVLAAIERSRD